MLWPSEVLPTPGGPTKHRIGLLPSGLELAHGQVLQDAPLDLVQAPVVLVQHRARGRDVQAVGAGRAPRQLGQPVQIRAQHRVLAGGLGHALQALEFLARVLFDLFRHAGLGDGLGDFLHLGRLIVGFAQLFLDGFELLAQHELALALVQLLAGLLGDVARDPQHLDAPREQFGHARQALRQVHQFEDFLFLLGLQVHVADDQVGQRRAGRRRLDGVHQLGRRLRQQFERLQRLLAQVQYARLGVDAGLRRGRQALHPRQQVRVAGDEVQHPEALLALAHQVVRAVLGGHEAQHAGHGADAVQVVRAGVVDAGVLLQQKTQRPVAARGFLRGFHRALAADRERHHHARKQHQVAHRQDQQHVVADRAHGRGGDFGIVRVHVHSPVSDSTRCSTSTRQPWFSSRRSI